MAAKRGTGLMAPRHLGVKRKARRPITAAEAGRRAWKGKTKAERSTIMRERVFARWHYPCGQRRNGAHYNSQCSTPDCPGRKQEVS